MRNKMIVSALAASVFMLTAAAPAHAGAVDVIQWFTGLTSALMEAEEGERSPRLDPLGNNFSEGETGGDNRPAIDPDG